MEEDPDCTEDEVEAELAVIHIQMGYVLQRLGQNEEALKLYNHVIKNRYCAYKNVFHLMYCMHCTTTTNY